MGRGGQGLEAAARRRAVGGRPWASGIVWSRSPHTIRVGMSGEQVQPIGGADALALEVDDRAERVQERLARAGLLERAQGAGDRLQVDAPARP